LLVAIVLLFIVTAFAALAIDLVTFYTARSEAQIAADGAALAAARVLANSGMTSDLPSDPNYGTLVSNAVSLATTVATQVATTNQVGGRNLSGAEVSINFHVSDPNFGTNPQVTVQVQRADLPTFFARIWGRTQITVSASATAEAYNPSGQVNITTGSAPPVAPSCVKPWLLPNLDPNSPSGFIFDPGTGAIQDPGLLGQTVNATGTCANGLCVACSGQPPEPGFCTVGMPAHAWQYYPGSQTDFAAPSQALPTCSAGFAGVNKAYQLSIAGCVQQPIVCGQNSSVTLDSSVDGTRMDADTANAVTCLTHAQNNHADSVDPPPPQPPGQPFQFLAGTDNPVVSARGHDVVVSSSLVTVPVVDNFTASAKVIGFIQVFLNPSGAAASSGAPAEIVNLVGCGPTMSGQPILGNGASPVAVRLISR
jgi:hypothetical protein